MKLPRTHATSSGLALATYMLLALCFNPINASASSSSFSNTISSLKSTYFVQRRQQEEPLHQGERPPPLLSTIPNLQQLTLASVHDFPAIKRRSQPPRQRQRKRQSTGTDGPPQPSTSPSGLPSSASVPAQSQALPSAPLSPPTPSAGSSQPQQQQPIALILPQNQPNVTSRAFPFTPMTGANYSLELTPNVPSREGLVEIRVGVLLPYSLPNNLTQQLAFR